MVSRTDLLIQNVTLSFIITEPLAEDNLSVEDVCSLLLL